MAELKCSYSCPFHRGKIEWHHPCSEYPDVGLYLCEAHHSLLQGRHVRYQGEILIDLTLQQMKADLVKLERHAVENAGLTYDSIDKH